MHKQRAANSGNKPVSMIIFVLNKSMTDFGILK